jgi:hypothetical protein
VPSCVRTAQSPLDDRSGASLELIDDRVSITMYPVGDQKVSVVDRQPRASGFSREWRVAPCGTLSIGEVHSMARRAERESAPMDAEAEFA